MKLRRLSHRSFLVLLSVALTLLTTGFAPPGGPDAPAAVWRIETSAPSYARNASIAVDSQGVPHVAYCGVGDLGLSAVRYATRGASAWSSQQVFLEYCVATALAIDAGDEAHIAYEHAGLKYAHYTGGAWQVETVDSQLLNEGKLTIVLDSGRRPHILYSGYSTAGDTLKYARRVGATWVITTINPGDTVHPHGMPALALDSADRPHVCYATPTGNLLKYGRYDGSAWHFETLAEHSGYNPCSLALDAQDHPHISYSSTDFFGTLGLVYAYHNGSGWQRTQLDSEPMASNWAGSSLALDKAGRPRVAYQVPEGSGDRLVYIRFDGGSWRKEEIATLAKSLFDDVRLALDGNGQPHVSCKGHSDDYITYATRETPVLRSRAYLPLIRRAR